MTATSLTAPAIWGPIIPGNSQASAIGSDATFTFNGAADKMWFVFQTPSATPPDQIKFKCTTFTSTGTIDVTLETVDETTGFPSGTPVTNSNTASVSVTSTGTKTVTGLSGTAVLTAQTTYAIVLTATTGFAGNFVLLRTTGGNGNLKLPYSGTKDSAGAHAKLATTNCGFCIGLLTSGGVAIYVPGFAGAYSAALVTYGSATNPFERGSRFTLPVPVTIAGVYLVCANGSVPAGITSMEVDLYTSHTSGSPVLQASQVFDGDIMGAGLGMTLMFSTPYALAANTVAALIIKATGATGPSLLRYQYASTAEVGCLLDVNCYATTRNGGTGAFTDTNTDCYAVYPILSQLDNGAGGSGGMLVHPGLSGGARG